MIKSILLACTGEKPSTAAANFAVGMAKMFSAHLTAILPQRLSLNELGVPGWFSRELKTGIAEAIKAQDADIRETFERIALEQLPDNQVHWINSETTADRTLVQYARMYDITIVASPPERRAPTDIHPDLIALQSGLPIIVVPDNATIDSMSAPAVIAWDGQRAATRALRDSLVLLKGRPSVSILTIEGSNVGEPLPGIDVQLVLERHGIAADWVKKKRGSKSITKHILDHCADVSAGLLVMGAYEHSKFSEDVLGGVTRDIAQGVRIPILLSH